VTRIVTDTGEVIEALDGGLVVAFATDTVYGIAASVSTPGAAHALSEAKRRSTDTPLQVLVSGLEQAASLAEIPERASRVAAKLWPGAVTLVVRRRPDVNLDLGPALETVGLRWPSHATVNEVCDRCGPLLATSANMHGDPPALTARDVARTFGDSVSVVLDGGTCAGLASTVLDLTSDPPRILREGAVAHEAVLEAL
jgi:L-threonylcarbamoyladenylate synthase